MFNGRNWHEISAFFLYLIPLFPLNHKALPQSRRYFFTVFKNPLLGDVDYIVYSIEKSSGLTTNDDFHTHPIPPDLLR